MEQDGDFSIGFGDSKMKEIFCKMAADQSKINAELARKVAFLSAAKIYRPGETYVIRKRREALAQALTREPAGRLRSNPRKKRFNGMITPVKRSRKDWSLHGTIHNTNGAKTREKTKREGTKRSVLKKIARLVKGLVHLPPQRITKSTNHVKAVQLNPQQWLCT